MAPEIALIIGTIISVAGFLLIQRLADWSIAANNGSVGELGMKPEVDATLGSESEFGQATSAETVNLIEQIQQDLTAKRWRTAKDALSAFEDLGTLPDKGEPRESVLYEVEGPGWQLAKRLDSYADILRLHSIGVLIVAAIWTAAVGGFLYSLANSQGAPSGAAVASAIVFAVALAAVTAIGSGIYAYFWSGRNGPYIDYLVASFVTVIAIVGTILLLLYLVVRVVTFFDRR